MAGRDRCLPGRPGRLSQGFPSKQQLEVLREGEQEVAPPWGSDCSARIHNVLGGSGMCRKLLATIIILCPVAAACRAADKEYDFQQKPVQALETIGRLKHLSTGKQALAPDEPALLADAQDGRL